MTRAKHACVELSHDPFSRESLLRKTALATSGCAWCGGFRHRADQPRPALFRYGTERDDRPGRINWHDGLFCSKSCHDQFHRS